MATGVQSTLHGATQLLLVPVIAVLAVLVVYSVYQVGTLIAESARERRHLNASIPELLDAIDASGADGLAGVIEGSGLLERQRAALLELVGHAALPIDDLLALARKLSHVEESHYAQVAGRTDYVAKIAPMFGLMGTLIPLGPGIIALADGDTATLSSALLIAFDTTTAGLLAAAVALTVSKFRKRWYAAYMTSLEAAMTAVLRKLRDSAPADVPGDAPALPDGSRSAHPDGGWAGKGGAR